MKVNIYENVGSYSKSLDIEYDSSIETDRSEAEKYISRMIPTEEEILEKDTEVE